MGNYGAGAGPVPATDYTGTGTYAPTSAEQQTQALTVPNTGTVVPYGQGGDVGTQVINLLEGLGQVGAAAAEVLATDGALTPVALGQAGIGLAQAYTAATALFGGGGTGPGAGLTTTQDANLSSILSNTAAVAIARACWETWFVDSHADSVTGEGFVTFLATDIDSILSVLSGWAPIFTKLAGIVSSTGIAVSGSVPIDRFGKLWVSGGNVSALTTSGVVALALAYNPADVGSGESMTAAAARQLSGSVASDYGDLGGLVTVAGSVLVGVGGAATGPLALLSADYALYREYTTFVGGLTRLVLQDINQHMSLVPVKYS